MIRSRTRPLTGFRRPNGPAVLAVYNLPAELPLESSTYFSGKLKEYVPALAAAHFDRPFAEMRPAGRAAPGGHPLSRASSRPDYAYLAESIG